MSNKVPSTVIINELTRIRTTLARMEQEESSSKQAFNTLYNELEEYKEGFALKIEKIILQDLLSFCDSMQWFQQSLTEDSDAANNFEHIYGEFLDLLHRYDVYPFQERTHFDAQFHRVIETTPTEDPDKEGLIQRVLSKGFMRAEQVLRFEEVVIYQYTPQS